MLFCVSAQITNDDDLTTRAVEEDEFFDVTLTSGDSIDLVGGNTRVIIRDDDGEYA